MNRWQAATNGTTGFPEPEPRGAHSRQTEKGGSDLEQSDDSSEKHSSVFYYVNVFCINKIWNRPTATHPTQSHYLMQIEVSKYQQNPNFPKIISMLPREPV